jgi:V/A-type H+/Na+-transporting ATPase subunit I
MSVVQMQKVAVLAHISLRENVLDVLQEEGVLEVGEAENAVRPDHTEVRFRKADLVFAISVLKDRASKETQASISKNLNVKNIISAAKHTDVRGIVEKLQALEESDTELTRIINESQQILTELEPWSDLPYSLSLSNETESVARILGTVPNDKLEQMEIEIADKLPRTSVEKMPLNPQEKHLHVCIHIWKEDASEFEIIATKYGWSTVNLSSLEGTPVKIMEEARVAMKDSESKKAKNEEERVRLSVELPNLTKVHNYVGWLDAKQEAREVMAETDETVTLLGWIPGNIFEKLESKLQKLSQATALLKVKPEEGEETPVLLKNRKLITPFESVTGLYGLPLYKESDPTASLAPFFILYFALCLTDAGYGAVIALIFGTFLWKTKKSIAEARLIWLLFFGGVATFFVSIPFGGWFGFAPSQAPEFLTKTTANGELLFRGQIWNLSAESGITFLQNLSLVLGITHISYGMFLAGMHKWIHNRKIEALWMDFTSHLLIGAAIFAAASPAEWKSFAMPILYASVALMVWGKGYGTKWFLRPIVGAIGLLNFGISMLSNTLSFLRLLALGLVTGAIAMAVNQVAVEMGKLFPIWLAIPVIILIFTLGHLVSIALNTLGSFIHSGRLQFIEFFSQFFEGGGRSFNPLRRTIS